MKQLIIIIAIMGVVSSCKKGSFLDPQTSTTLNEQLVFTDSLRTIQFLTAIYSDAGYSFRKDRWDSHGNVDPATDEAEYAYSGGTQKAVSLYAGTYNAANILFPDFWTTPYTNIRRVNLLLSKLPTTPLSVAKQKRMAAEARFLRVWYYHQLVKAYGGIPLIGDKVYGNEDLINLPRSTYEACVDYMVKELDECAALLPLPGTGAGSRYAEEDYGRVTSGACLALKSRILLFAASPLFNGGATTTDAALAKVVSYPTYDVSRWQKAADAALAVITANYYALNVDNITAPGYGFYNVFLKRVNSEYIFAKLRAANKDFEVFYGPPTRGGASYQWATENLARAFLMKNGKSTDDATSGYNPNDPYVNRDPRFRYSIIYNGSLYYLGTANAQKEVYTYVGSGNDAYSTRTSTGYYIRKMCDANTSAASGSNTERGWPLIRYAEILLNYVEAVNEAGHPDLAYAKLIELRSRAGIDPGADNLYGLKANMTTDELRPIIQNERRIELAYEDHRFWDVRRWKIAMTVNNGYNKCMKITKVGSAYTYEVVNSVRLHNFRPEMYLFPIQQTEISKMPAMVQNPGW